MASITSTLQEEHSLQTDLQIVLELMSLRTFLVLSRLFIKTFLNCVFFQKELFK